MAKKWSEEEVEFLKNNFDNMSCKEIAIKLGRTVRGVQHKFGQLALKHKSCKIGDVVGEWEIINIYVEEKDYAKIKMTTLKSTVNSLIIERPLYRINSGITPRNKHNASDTRLYSIWIAAKRRCNPKNEKQYPGYAGAGIKFCDEWLDFRAFESWSSENNYSDELSLDRIDNEKGYEPSNCRWVTIGEQNDNKSNVDNSPITAWGETKGIFAWLRDDRCKTTLSSLRYRNLKGWNAEEAISEPSRKSSKQDFTTWIKKNKPEVYQEYLDNRYNV